VIALTPARGAAFDAAVIGGGVMGCTAALYLARAGLRVVLFERRFLCAEASGVNAGTLSMQHAPSAELVPFALKARELWRDAPQWLGTDMRYRQLGGLVLAFSDDEAARLKAKMDVRRDAGVPIEYISGARARELEPALSAHPVLASWCPLDGDCYPVLTGGAYRRALAEAGVDVREAVKVGRVAKDGAHFVIEAGADGAVVRAARLLIAAGAWAPQVLASFGLGIDMTYKVNQMVVTERLAPTVTRNLGVADGNLSLKQAINGTVLIGGGWDGRADPATGMTEVMVENVVPNLRLACHAVPALRDARIQRIWIGVRDHSADLLPLIGPLPGVDGAFIVSCVREGYTTGPCVGRVIAEVMQDREPDFPLYDPARLIGPDRPKGLRPESAASLALVAAQAQANTPTPTQIYTSHGANA
jgi:sarcosine oxidase subunit beta